MRRLVLTAAVGLLVAAGLGGGIVYWSYLGTPEYSLARAALAYRQRDFQAFSTYVDVDAVVGAAIDDVIASTAQPAPGGAAETTFAALGKALAQTLLSSLKPDLTAGARTALQSYFATGSFGSAPPAWTQGPMAAAGALVSGLDGDPTGVYRGLDYVRVDGATAHAGVRIHPKQLDEDVVFDLLLERESDLWRVTSITNLRELVAGLKSRKS
jgi:hypothetical protein